LNKRNRKLEPLVSVVLLNYNGKKFLKLCLVSILQSNYSNLEVIFVDNHSTDGSVEFVKDLYGRDPRVRVVQNRENMGWSKGNNEGMKVAKGEIIVLLSNDMEVDTNWLSEIVRVMNSDPTVGVAQFNSLSMHNREKLDSAGNFLDPFGYAYSYVARDSLTEVFFAEGMAMAVKRKVIKEIGMLDEYYFMEYDDMDFSWRARLRGYKVMFVTSAIVYHARGGFVGATVMTRNPLNVATYARNHLITLIKNYELRNLAKALPVVLFFDFAKVVNYAVNRNVRALAVWKGLFMILKDFKTVWWKRLEVQYKIRKVPDRVIKKSMTRFNMHAQRLFLSLQAQSKRLFLVE